MGGSMVGQFIASLNYIFWQQLDRMPKKEALNHKGQRGLGFSFGYTAWLKKQFNLYMFQSQIVFLDLRVEKYKVQYLK